VHFDPNIHEAVVTEEDPSLPAHTVVAILQKGYYLHDRLLRPALVKVAVGGPE
jgi:molecular chaperone GrpE